VPGPLKLGATGRLIRKLRRPGIVYCATTTAVDQLSNALERAHIPMVRYHGKMRAADRAEAQSQFMRPRRRLIMVATSAFGMGIDKPNIRYIAHYHAPGSLEQYVQEAGRAGRDGRPAHCILLFDEADLAIQERLQALGRPSVWHLARLERALAAWAAEDRAPSAAALALSAGVSVRICEALLSDLEDAGLVERDEERRVIVAVSPESFRTGAPELVAKLRRFRHEGARRLAAVAEYAKSDECRSVFLRRYFGEEHPPSCGNCDRCRPRVVAPVRAGVSPGVSREDRRRTNVRPARSARGSSGAEARRNAR
jgi:ATP-dependent DNA helicase RecQ